MKNLMKAIVTGLVLFCSVNSFASSYEERNLAKCETFNLVAATIGSQQADGSLVSETRYLLRFVNGAEILAEQVQYEDLTQWSAETAPNTLLIVSKTFQPSGMTYSWSLVQSEQVISSGTCAQTSPVILY